MRLPGGALSVDRVGPGRGAWLCRASPDCLREAQRRHGFERAFRQPVDEAEVEELRRRLAAAKGAEGPMCEDVGLG